MATMKVVPLRRDRRAPKKKCFISPLVIPEITCPRRVPLHFYGSVTDQQACVADATVTLVEQGTRHDDQKLV